MPWGLLSEWGSLHRPRMLPIHGLHRRVHMREGDSSAPIHRSSPKAPGPHVTAKATLQNLLKKIQEKENHLFPQVGDIIPV